MAEPLRPYETRQERHEASSGELRQETPRWILQVLDAVAIARGKPRTVIVNEILGAHASQLLHESTLVCRVAGVNPLDSGYAGRRS